MIHFRENIRGTRTPGMIAGVQDPDGNSKLLYKVRSLFFTRNDVVNPNLSEKKGNGD